MSFQPGAEGSLSESVHFPPTTGCHEHQGYHMAMAPPSRALRGAPYVHDDGRGGGGGGAHYMHSAGLEYDYSLRRHSCGEHLGLHSGALLEHLLLQENQKALRMASLVQSQASGCLSGCLSCGLSEKRLRFKDSDDRMIEDQRCYSRNGGEGPSRSMKLGPEAEGGENSEGWFRQPRPRQSIGGVGERSQSRISFTEDELGRSLYQGRRISYPVAHPTISHSQASHHVPDQPFHAVGAMESSVPSYGFSDADVRGRQRWPTARLSYSENGIEDDGWHRASKSRVGPASTRERDRMSLPGSATGSLPRNLIGSPHRPTGDSALPAQSARTTSQSLHVLPENSLEPSYQDNVQQQAGTQRVVTQGPVSLTNWYIIKVQNVEVGRALETKVAVGGWIVQNGEHVKTSPIVNRLDIHKVVTEDGVEVSLEGTIDQETSTANGFAPGIVQCLSAGFPYMWKQLLRVRPVGESPSLAVSESLGGLHPKASKCISEDESQGNIDPKNSKAIPEGMPCSSRDCEGNSPAPTVNAKPSVDQTPPNIALEAEAAVDVRAGTSDPNKATACAIAGTSDAIDARVSARAETIDAVETEVVTVDTVAPQADDRETSYLGAVTATSDANDTDAVVIASAKVSDAMKTQCSPQDLRTQDASLGSLNPVLETEAPAPATEAPATKEPALATEAPALVTETSAPATDAPVEFLTTEFPSKESEDGPIIDTTLVTTRNGRKKKKGPSHPRVRSSMRLQQRHSSSSEFTLSTMDSLILAQTEQVLSSMDIIADRSGEEESARVQTGCEALTKANSIIEEVLKDLHQMATEVVEQSEFPGAEFVDVATDPQPMEVENFCQVQDHRADLSRDADGVENPTVKNKTIQDEFEGVEIEETIPEAPPSVASVEVEETNPEAPPNVAIVEVEETVPEFSPSVASEEIEETVPEPPSELGNEEIEESAPVTPPELLQSKLQSRIGSLDKPSSEGMPQGSNEQIFPDPGTRMTRSLKRRLKLTPNTETVGDAAPFTRSLKRLRRHSASTVPTPDTTPNVEPITYQGEGRSVEPDSNPETPHQAEADAFFVRVRGNSNKAVSCSNCQQPCLPQGLLNYNSNVVSSEVTPEERVLKMEQGDYPPLDAETFGAPEQPIREQTETETSAMRRRSDRLKRMKPANRFVKTVTSRKLLGDEIVQRRRSSGEYLHKGSGDRKSLGESSRKGASERSPLGGDSRKESRKKRSLGEDSGTGLSVKRSLGEDSGTGSSEKRSLGEDSGNASMEGPLSATRGKSRRTSMIPPPLPPPRVQDKSKVPEAFGLKTSRSGRLLVPPLAYWRSQSIEYDKDGGIIAIFDGFQAKPADTGCFNFTPPQEKQARRIQEKLCKAAATTVKKRK